MKFDPSGDARTARQMLALILVREMEAAENEDDLKTRLREVLAPLKPPPPSDKLKALEEAVQALLDADGYNGPAEELNRRWARDPWKMIKDAMALPAPTLPSALKITVRAALEDDAIECMCPDHYIEHDPFCHKGTLEKLLKETT